jgi:hypothetical protein
MTDDDVDVFNWKHAGLTPTRSDEYREASHQCDLDDLRERVAKLERASKRAVTKNHLDLVTTALTNVLRDTLREIDEKIESKSASVEWKGVWSEGMDLPAGSLCTDFGSLWLATSQTRGARPGMNGCWKLVCKSGDHNGSNGARRHVATATRGTQCPSR